MGLGNWRSNMTINDKKRSFGDLRSWKIFDIQKMPINISSRSQIFVVYKKNEIGEIG